MIREAVEGEEVAATSRASWVPDQPGDLADRPAGELDADSIRTRLRDLDDKVAVEVDAGRRAGDCERRSGALLERRKGRTVVDEDGERALVADLLVECDEGLAIQCLGVVARGDDHGGRCARGLGLGAQHERLPGRTGPTSDEDRDFVETGRSDRLDDILDQLDALIVEQMRGLAGRPCAQKVSPSSNEFGDRRTEDDGRNAELGEP